MSFLHEASAIEKANIPINIFFIIFLFEAFRN
jgi:hypothetical protein